MANNRARSRLQSMKTAFCGMMVALSVVLMLAGGMIPIATYCVPMACGLLLLPVLLEYGKKAAWTVFAAVSVIALILGIDKEAAFFYLFLGYYPLVKWDIDRIRSKPVRLAAKLLLFNASLLVMYAVLGLVLNMDAVVAEFTQMGAALLAAFGVTLNLCLLLFDRLLTPMVCLYVYKLRPRLKFLRR